MKNKKLPMGDEESYSRDLNFLKELKLALTYTDNVNISKLAEKHNFKSRSRKMVALYQGGVIEKIGGHRYASYKWASPIEPNMRMVNEMNKRAFAINAADGKRSRSKAKLLTNQLIINDVIPKSMGGKREGAGRKSLKEEIKQYKTRKISIAWGFINIEY